MKPSALGPCGGLLLATDCMHFIAQKEDCSLSSLRACRVNEFTSQSMRVSITLEQYQLPSRLLPLVSDYKVRRLQY